MVNPNESRQGKPQFDLHSELDLFGKERKKQEWEGSFKEYFEMVTENPRIVRTAHRYLFDAITTRPDFFSTGDNALFGSEKATDRLKEVLEAGARGLEPARRILLLMGPVGGGKSTLVTAMKRGMEEYSLTDEGALYAIKGCPMREEPLHLLPKDIRKKVEEATGVHVEGDLCPQCNAEYGENPDKIREAKVERIFLSEKDRIGIGTFQPSDPKSQDIAELVGSVDFSRLADYGSQSDPRAYKFDGELNVANRGMMEFVEMLKSDERFLYILLSLAQEKVIKTGRFANISADEVVIAHTNETEYKKFVGKKENEALHDRTIIVPVPYNLRVTEEGKIYDKLTSHGELREKVHISPKSLRVAAMVAILSRLATPKKAGVDIIRKMRAYDGEQVHGITDQDIKELQEETRNEGMSGLSPRFIIDSISTTLIKEGRVCLTPMDTLRALKDGLESHVSTRDLPEKEREKNENFIAQARELYNDEAKDEVQRAFVYAYEDAAQTVMNNYLDNAEAFVNKSKVKDQFTGEDVQPDEKLMREVEETIQIADSAKRDFRQEIVNRLASLGRRGQKFELGSHPKLKEGIEKRMFAQLQDMIKITTSARTPDAEQQRRINDVSDRLKAEQGYCDHCASELIRYVGTLLNR